MLTRSRLRGVSDTADLGRGKKSKPQCTDAVCSSSSSSRFRSRSRSSSSRSFSSSSSSSSSFESLVEAQNEWSSGGVISSASEVAARLASVDVGEIASHLGHEGLCEELNGGAQCYLASKLKETRRRLWTEEAAFNEELLKATSLVVPYACCRVIRVAIPEFMDEDRLCFPCPRCRFVDHADLDSRLDEIGLAPSQHARADAKRLLSKGARSLMVNYSDDCDHAHDDVNAKYQVLHCANDACSERALVVISAHDRPCDRDRYAPIERRDDSKLERLPEKTPISVEDLYILAFDATAWQ